MTQVISKIDFNKAKILAGEIPTPSVLNRPLIATIDAAARLEEALQYTARSMRCEVTPTTKFLAHFEGTGLDSIGNVVPTQTGADADLYVNDGIFYGSCFTQGPCTNLLSATSTDSSLTSLTGWLVDNPPDVHADFIVNRNGTRVINTKYSGDVTPGTITLVSQSIGVSALSVLSFSVGLTTPTNLKRKGVLVSAQVVFYDEEENEVSISSIETNTNAFTGRLECNNFNRPDSAVTAKVRLAIDFSKADSKADLTLKGFMLENSAYSHSYTKTSRSAVTVRYTDVIDGTPGLFSIFFWAKFRKPLLRSHTAPIGPLFVLNNDQTFTLGAVHKGDSGESFKVSLQLKVNDTILEGNAVTLPLEYTDQYIPCLLRAGNFDVEGEVKTRFEFVAIDPALSLYKSTIEAGVDTPVTIPESLDIAPGYDFDRCDYANIPITELRYDEEWINDYQFMIVALTKHPFSLGNEGNLNLKKLREYLDLIGVNIVKNPRGLLGLNFWNGCPAGFNSVYRDLDIGSGFVWSGGAISEDTSVESDKMPIKGGEAVVFRAKVGSITGTTGEYGIGLSFVKTDGVTSVGSTLLMPAVVGLAPEYYDISTTAPADAAYAVVSMYMKNGFNSTKAMWTKLKLEYGTEGTMFTDDSTPQYAVLAP